MPTDEGGPGNTNEPVLTVEKNRVYRGLVTPTVDTIRSPGQATIEDVTTASVALVGLLVVAVPVVVIAIDVPLLVAVAVAGVLYAAFCYGTDRVTAGLIGAVFALPIFMANVPIVAGPLKADLNVYLADPLAVLLFLALLRDTLTESSTPTANSFGLVAITTAGAFVGWTFLSAVVGNGPSQFAATVFAVEQTRYLLLFVVSALFVYRTEARLTVYPLLISIGGNLLYAVAEGLSGRTFGLTYLGDSDGKLLSEFAVGPLVLQAGYYAGGFVGHTRQLIGLLLLLLPFLVFWTVYGDRLLTAASVVAIACVAFVVRLGETDAGWFASLLVLVLLGISFVPSLVGPRQREGIRGSVAAVFGAAVSLLLYRKRFTGSSADGTPAAGGAATSTGTTGTGSTTETSIRTAVLEVASLVPGIEVDTLGIRLTQYVAALDVALAYPLFGIGGYNFVLRSQEYGLPSSLGVHNTFFSHLASVGFPGALAYTVSVLAVLVLVVRELVSAAGQRRVFWGCMLIGLLGFHAYSFWVVMYGWLAPNAGFWIVSGTVVGALGFTSD